MDKFGIFNLFNSFFSGGGQKEGQSFIKSDSSADLLGNIVSALSAPKKEPPAPAQTQNVKVFAPLQSSMLKTMTMHDDIVKRVKGKNPESK